MAKITYQDKVFLNQNSQVADINKVTDTDLNQIKNVVNGNDANVGDLSDLNTVDKTSTVNAINEVVGRIEEEETNLKTLFKFKTLSVPISIAGNGHAAFQMGWLDQTGGYSYLGILSKESGYGDQWQITYSLYQGNKIYADVKNNYSQTLSSSIACTVVYIKSDYLTKAIAGDENGTE